MVNKWWHKIYIVTIIYCGYWLKSENHVFKCHTIAFKRYQHYSWTIPTKCKVKFTTSATIFIQNYASKLIDMEPSMTDFSSKPRPKKPSEPLSLAKTRNILWYDPECTKTQAKFKLDFVMRVSSKTWKENL